VAHPFPVVAMNAASASLGADGETHPFTSSPESPMLHRLAALVLLLALLAPACVVIDVRADHEGHGFESVGLIHGFATAGWPAEDSLLKLGIFDGRSDGTILLFQVWKLLRVEIGLIGVSVGIGPLDAGIGVLFYDPVPPPYCDGCDDEECEEPAGDEVEPAPAHA